MPNIPDLRDTGIPQYSVPHWTRRKFLGAAAAIAAASTIGCGDAKKSEHEEESHAKEEGDHHMTRDEKKEELRKQQQLPFHRDPHAWLRNNADIFRRGFDLSGKPVTTIEEYCIEDALPLEVREGVRLRRTPGTTILQGCTVSLARIRECIRGFTTDGGRIAYRGNAHDDCGAGKKFAQDNHLSGESDLLAEEEIRRRIMALRDLQIDASFGTRIAMETMRRSKGFHHAIMGIVCQDGTFHDWQAAGLPPSFVASSHDPEEVAHGVDIMLKVARSGHGYGDILEKFTILALQNGDNTALSGQMLEHAQQIAKNYRKDMDIQVIPWDAPQRRG